MHQSVVQQIRAQGPVQQLKQAQAATLSVTTPELRVKTVHYYGRFRCFFRSNSEPLTSNGKRSITDNSALSEEVLSDTELRAALRRIVDGLVQNAISGNYKQYKEALAMDLSNASKTYSNLEYSHGAGCSRINHST